MDLNNLSEAKERIDIELERRGTHNFMNGPASKLAASLASDLLFLVEELEELQRPEIETNPEVLRYLNMIPAVLAEISISIGMESEPEATPDPPKRINWEEEGF